MTVRAVTGAPVAEVVLDRPDARNALSIEMCRGIVAALDEVRATSARCVLLRGEGKVFCSGADFAAVSGPGGLEFLPAFEEMLTAVESFPLPVVAMIQGAALGGGLQLATVCDFRIAADDAKVGIPAARIGIVVNFENVERLVRLAGVAAAKEILMTASTMTGGEAEARGLVTKAVPALDLEATARAFAQEIADLSPQSVQGAKRSIGLVERALVEARRTHPDEVAEIDGLVAAAYGSTDLQEGLAAMAERRPPRWEG
ncbi:MAG TPA: enoyl-CoA hydratase/isomerase family protein [Actinomycetota bacterium]|nr:enoyl-CoA hydratase/isomerase family protein [Actinomycetota bacterium]